MPQLLGLHIDIVGQEGSSICYMILPGPLKESEKAPLLEFSTKHSCYIAVISGLEWEHDLTPWAAAGIKGDDFGGKADSFLKKLCCGLIPELDDMLDLHKPKRYLAGVSLSGLFALWASCKTDIFEAVGSVSASLWYDGFTDWLQRQQLYAKRYYLSLGIKEKDGKNPRLASVDEHTSKAISIIRDSGAEVFFEYNEGNHFGPLMDRMRKAMAYILQYRI